MELLRRESDYALRCLLYLAVAAGDRMYPARLLARAENIPEPMLRKILQKLARAGIVDSALGSHGGFRLHLPPEEITVLMVLEAIQGPVTASRCLVNRSFCPHRPKCVLSTALAGMQAGVEELFACTTLYDLTGGGAGPILADAGPHRGEERGLSSE